MYVILSSFMMHLLGFSILSIVSTQNGRVQSQDSSKTAARPANAVRFPRYQVACIIRYMQCLDNLPVWSDSNGAKLKSTVARCVIVFIPERRRDTGSRDSRSNLIPVVMSEKSLHLPIAKRSRNSCRQGAWRLFCGLC